MKDLKSFIEHIVPRFLIAHHLSIYMQCHVLESLPQSYQHKRAIMLRIPCNPIIPDYGHQLLKQATRGVLVLGNLDAFELEIDMSAD
jgi:hypothetical protein